MKNLMLIFIMLIVLSLFANQVTVYNDNFALVRTDLELDLKKGIQDIFLDDIPSMIEANSVIIKSKKKGLDLFSQNYEYDLANTNKILQKYIGKKIEIFTNTDDKFSGILQFQDHESLGIIEESSENLILIKKSELRNIDLEKLPENFFLKPTLHWRIQAEKAGKYPIDFSYICSGMRWEVTYNAVWDDVNEKLQLSSWVTLTNETGKGFHDTKLKLIAGDVRKMRDDIYFGRDKKMEPFMFAEGVSAPEFEEKAFHDFHLYTLSEKVSINNMQTKQLRLFPTTDVKAKSRYEYITTSDKVISMIEFTNSDKAGLGIPLPKGVVKIYKLDVEDENLEFIGEDWVGHIPREEKVILTTGFAFDLIGETEILDQRKEGKKIHEKDMAVTLKNRSEDDKVITVIHNLYGYWTIRNENVDFVKKSATKVEFVKELKAGETFTINWTERIEY